MAEPRRIQRFEVVEHLGTGGMGAVYRARDPQLERDVAIKVLLRPLTRTPQLSENDTLDLRRNGPVSADDLLREARMMAQLSHQNVLPVYEVGLSDGAVFVVMEYIAGPNLRTWMGAEHTTAEILDAFRQAGLGLAAAHACGIVHRDFKPENVLIGSDGRVRVADFGLSRLSTHGSSAMVRFDDSGGTPGYMAPELWRGDAATPKSDVYAFCIALREALAGHEVPAEVATRLLAGIADAPAARPGLDELIDAIAGRRPRRPWRWIVAGGAVAATLGVVGALALSRHDAAKPSCAVAPDYFAGRWDPVVRAKLGAVLAHGGQAAPVVDTTLAGIDKRAAAIAGEVEAVCEAERDGKIGQLAAPLRRACLDRRTFAMSGAVQAVIASGKAPDPGHELLTWWPPLAQCSEITQAPVADLRAEEQRYRAYFSADGMDVAEATRAMTTLVDEATRAGDSELVGTASIMIGTSLNAQRDPAADTWLQRAYRSALEIHSNDVAAQALIVRSNGASQRHDDQLSHELAELARDLADKPTTWAKIRVGVYTALGDSVASRGNYLAAIDDFRKALDILVADGRHPEQELKLRLELANAFSNVPEKIDSGVTIAREAVALTRKEYGNKDFSVGIALNVLGRSLGIAGKHDEALAAQREALEIIRANRPDASIDVGIQYLLLAQELGNNGRYQEAVQAAQEVVDKHGAQLGADRETAVALLGLAQYNAGHSRQGLETLSQALEDATAHGEKDRPNTLDLREQYIRLLLAQHKTAEAERALTDLEASWRAMPEKRDVELATLSGDLRAQVALAHKQPAQAERLTRAALDAWSELHGGADEYVDLELLLANELLEQHRWQDAKAVLDQQRAHPSSRSDLLGEIDAASARAEDALGHHDQAVVLAKRAIAALKPFPADTDARHDAETVLHRH